MLVFSRIAAVIGLLCFSSAGAAPVAEERSIDAVFAQHLKAVQSRDLAALERTITAEEQLTLIQFEPVSRAVGTDFAVLTTKTSSTANRIAAAVGSRSRSARNWGSGG